MNQRTQYYGPDGEKLPVAVDLINGHFHNVEGGIQKILSIEKLSDTGRYIVTEAGTIRDDNGGGWTFGKPLYASDFTEEELKELVDEKAGGEYIEGSLSTKSYISVNEDDPVDLEKLGEELSQLDSCFDAGDKKETGEG